MPLTGQDASKIESYLNQIFDYILPAMNDRNRFQIRRYIDANEYALALDDMADITIESYMPIASELRSLFDAAAGLMNIKPGTEWSAVDDLLNPV